MIKIVTVVWVILLGGLVNVITGCTVVSSPEVLLPYDMDEEARPQISSTRVIVSVNLDNLENEKLADADYWLETGYIDEPLSDVNVKIKRLKWLNAKKIERLNSFAYQKIGAEILNTQEESLLLMDLSFSMSPDYTSLLATSHVSIFPRKKDLVTIAESKYQDGKFPVLYRNQFDYEYRYEGGYQDEQTTALAWFENDAAMVKKAIRSAVDAMSAMIVRDLSVIPGKAGKGAKRSPSRNKQQPKSLYDYGR